MRILRAYTYMSKQEMNKLTSFLIDEQQSHRKGGLAYDGKMRLTDVADQQQLFRIIQSIPSPKAEPFKQWMAQVASDRLDQMQDPELNFQQALPEEDKDE